jgi:hypothetical protein
LKLLSVPDSIRLLHYFHGHGIEQPGFFVPLRIIDISQLPGFPEAWLILLNKTGLFSEKQL